MAKIGLIDVDGHKFPIGFQDFKKMFRGLWG